MDTDLSKLFLHWLITVIILLAPPAGPAYNFIVDLYTVSWLVPPVVAVVNTKKYPGAWINGFVAAGLLYIRLAPSENWSSPFKSWLPVIVLYREFPILCRNEDH